jgi:hypothetical protein
LVLGGIILGLGFGEKCFEIFDHFIVTLNFDRFILAPKNGRLQQQCLAEALSKKIKTADNG